METASQKSIKQSEGRRSPSPVAKQGKFVEIQPSVDPKEEEHKATENEGGDQEQQDPYQGNEDQYQDHFRKTFITENQKKDGEKKQLWTLHDMIIPAGKTSKLVRVPNPFEGDFRMSEVCDRLKIVKPTPVIVLAGGMTQRA
jgi:hypothetical protein